MTWIEHLQKERRFHLEQIEFLGSGRVRLAIITDGESRDVTDERLQQTREHLAEVEQILRGEGIPLDA